mmetsp:Transcript_30051/g.77349  ORF Transcript_30051/g.77349 Transcript_30051/m.77349 type:complete len:385 (+) Transcript_30051:1-1155(+)
MASKRGPGAGKAKARPSSARPASRPPPSPACDSRLPVGAPPKRLTTEDLFRFSEGRGFAPAPRVPAAPARGPETSSGPSRSSGSRCPPGSATSSRSENYGLHSQDSVASTSTTGGAPSDSDIVKDLAKQYARSELAEARREAAQALKKAKVAYQCELATVKQRVQESQEEVTQLQAMLQEGEAASAAGEQRSAALGNELAAARKALGEERTARALLEKEVGRLTTTVDSHQQERRDLRGELTEEARAERRALEGKLHFEEAECAAARRAHERDISEVRQVWGEQRARLFTQIGRLKAQLGARAAAAEEGPRRTGPGRPPPGPGFKRPTEDAAPASVPGPHLSEGLEESDWEDDDLGSTILSFDGFLMARELRADTLSTPRGDPG